MADLPITLVIGETHRDAALYRHLSSDFSVLFADSADEVIDLTSDNEPIDVCLVRAANTEKAYELCTWMKTDNEVKNLPLVMLGDGDADAERWLSAGAIDWFDENANPALLAARLKSYSELKHKNDLLLQIASFDSLTSLSNRRRMDEYLDIEWRRSLREFYPLSLIQMDLDRFTAFNDHYGIGRGDEVLKRIARALEPIFNRAADMLSRYGGDEFVVLLPSLELDSALALAERMVEAVRDLGIEHELSETNVLTASAGVATIEPSRDKRCQDLQDEAGEMLYRAQQSGGDQAQGIAV